MNYYSRYPAHYLSKTLLLTLEQDGAYNRLIDWYYSEERGIPHDKRYAVGRCQGAREKSAVDYVLGEYFVRHGDTWAHERIEREIHKAAPKIEAAKANGKKGGRPRKDKPNGFQENNPLGFQEETQNEPNAKAPQSPITKEQKLSTDLRPVEVEISDSDPPADRKSNCPLQQIVEVYHAKLPRHPRVEKLTNARAGYIRQRWREDLPTIDAWANYFEDVSISTFLTGRAQAAAGKPPFIADLEWLCRPGNFAKVSEGKYHR